MNIDYHIRLSLEEDLGADGDVTTDAIFGDETASYKLTAKDHGVVCGLDVFKRVFELVDGGLDVVLNFRDGDTVNYGDTVAVVSGRVNSILKGERTALNYISHLSGISTKTAVFVKNAGDIKILDTRKTIPGLRELQKYAVKTGGGENHRIGLYDMVMIKDNHIDLSGGITQAVEKIRSKWGSRFKIEVETRNLKEVYEALDCGADRIMLDNMDIELMKEAIAVIGKKAEVEASGNMTLERLKNLTGIGIDYISFGELTHTVTVFDYSLVKL